MTQNKQDKIANAATTGSKRKTRIGHWIRVVVMFLTGAFIFPHALTEDEDIAKYDANKDVKVKKH